LALRQDNVALDEERIALYRAGRMGVAFVAAMFYIVFLSAVLLVPDWTEANKTEADKAAAELYYDDDEDKPPPSKVFVPMHWKRAHIIWAALATQVSILTQPLLTAQYLCH
jgi:hypothetical protein